MKMIRNQKNALEGHSFLDCVKIGRGYEIFFNSETGEGYIFDDLDAKVYVNVLMRELYFDLLLTHEEPREVPEENKPWPQVGAMTTKGKVLANYKGYTWVLVDGIPGTFLTSNLEKPKPTLAEFIDEYLHSHTDTPLIRLDLIRDAIGDYEND